MPILPAPMTCSQYQAQRCRITGDMQTAPAGRHSDSFSKDRHDILCRSYSFSLPCNLSWLPLDLGVQGGRQCHCQHKDYSLSNTRASSLAPSLGDSSIFWKTKYPSSSYSRSAMLGLTMGNKMQQADQFQILLVLISSL